ncbi:MAG: hypothetical protein GF315_03165 [candidate division Zixibacteria bacterium]|nr:hypothetical protein [candidate division Zixibacteria bacterium]
MALTVIGVGAVRYTGTFFGRDITGELSDFLWLDIWGQWDTVWYLDIAINGYSAELLTTPGVAGQGNYAFFPLYPMLIRTVGWITGHHFLVGLILSNLFLILASIYLYRMVESHYNEDMAKKTIKYLFIFPTSFVLSGVLTESMFLFLIILCFFFADRRNWLLVGALGFLLSLTRSIGVVVSIPLFYMYLRSIGFDFKHVDYKIFYFALFPLGLGLFMLHNYYLTGDFLAFVHIQAAWHRELSNPFVVLWNSLFHDRFYHAAFAIMSIAILLITFIWHRILSLPYFIYALLVVLAPLFSSIQSMPRLVLVAFPLYVIVAHWSREPLFDRALTIMFAMFQGFLMTMWANGQLLI